MPTHQLVIASAVVLIAGCAGILMLASLGPLQWPTVFVYTGLLIALAGLAASLRPPRRLGISQRSNAAFVAAGGALLLMAGLFWPAAARRGDGTSGLDAFLPDYHFQEFHEARIHASPERVMRAVREVTFADIGVMRTLGRIRSIAMGQLRPAAQPAAPAAPILTLIAEARTGFFPLLDGERAFVFGMAGQPWNNQARPVRLSPPEFRSWKAPGQVKIASDLRVGDAGGGWSRLTTETRVQANDDRARRIMARYWRFIYPGSGMIRRSLLEAIRLRAEPPR